MIETGSEISDSQTFSDNGRGIGVRPMLGTEREASWEPWACTLLLGAVLEVRTPVSFIKQVNGHLVGSPVYLEVGAGGLPTASSLCSPLETFVKCFCFTSCNL